MNLSKIIALAAERYPVAEAVSDRGFSRTYAQLHGRINRIAHALTNLGIGKGDHVVLSLKNSQEHVAAYWACQSIGAIATPVNWRYASGDVEFVVGDAEAVAVLFEEASSSSILAARPNLTAVRNWIFVGHGLPPDCIPFEQLDDGSEDPGAPAVDVTDADTSIMLYTSGTTGKPKGVPRSHAAEHSAGIAHAIQSGNTWADRTLGVMPLYHTMGVRSMIVMAMLNGCLVCLPDWDPAAAAQLLQSERVNSLYLVPTLYHDLIELPGITGYDLSRVKKLGYAGAPMSSTLTERVERIFRPQVFVNHLGSTEVYTHTVCDRALQKPTCAGRPGVFGRVRVVRPDSERKGSPDDLVERGVTGELIVSLDSAEAFGGYWKRPQATEKAIRGGWYFTGDLVFEDDEGDIYTVGRVDDMVISGGENIYPLEIEDVLHRHPDVAEACIVGLPDERLGQIVAAFIVPRQDARGAHRMLEFEQLDAFCQQAGDLANFKRPRRYEFVARLPKSPTGKLLRRLLLDGDYETLPAETIP